MNQTLTRSLGTWHVMVNGISLVVAASTLVSDFTGYFALGGAFALALILAFAINALLAVSAADSAGLVLTLPALCYAFKGAHVEYGPRALIVLAAALSATCVSFHMAARRGESEPRPHAIGGTASELPAHPVTANSTASS